MFEAAELGHKVSKKDYAEQAPQVREALLKAQYELLAKPDFPVIIIIGGVDGAGKGETVNLLNEWMDPRFIQTHAFGDPSDEESERPHMWRFWRALPPKGRIGILFGSWYTAPIVERVLGKGKGKGKDAPFMRSINDIKQFERMIVAEGALILKFWFHLSKKAQKKRLDDLEADPKTRWRVTAQDRERFKIYNRFRAVSEVALRETSTGDAAWHIVEGADHNYRSLTAGRIILDALKQRLADASTANAAARRIEPALHLDLPLDGRNVLNTLDYSLSMSAKEFGEQRELLQGKLALLTRTAAFHRRSMILVFEGQDAAGKGSTIRRITSALDARFYGVVPIAAPTEEERAQPYLWRFWRNLPRRGRVTIFDRSWYGRVLVERVENLSPEPAWRRAYHEINEFEEQLSDHGAIILKFWIAITKDEQLARFKSREEIPFKNFKITKEDWRNRDKWDAYEHAVCEMVDRTSTTIGPWNVIPGNNKLYARMTVLRIICETLEKALDADRKS